MDQKKIDLDEPTLRVMRKILNTPPKPHEKMKIGRSSQQKKKRGPKDRAASAKQHNV